MIQPRFIVETNIPVAPKRIYEYRMKHADTTVMFAGLFMTDLMGNFKTRDALVRALDQYYSVHGPIKEHTVILHTGDWAGRFTIDNNKNTDTLILRLTESADTRIHSGIPPVML